MIYFGVKGNYILFCETKNKRDAIRPTRTDGTRTPELKDTIYVKAQIHKYEANQEQVLINAVSYYFTKNLIRTQS